MGQKPWARPPLPASVRRERAGPPRSNCKLYLALVAALLLQNYAGTAPDQRLMELIRWHLVGMASLAELEAGVALARPSPAQKIVN